MTRRHGNAIKLATFFAVPCGLLMGIWVLAGRGLALGLVLAFVGVAAAGVSLAGCSWFVLRAMAARPATEFTAPQYFAVVKELSKAAGVPMPRLYISPAPAPNAFTVGRGPRTAAICVTQGLLELLTPRQLRAVLAHELMHIKNRDLLSASLGSVLAALIGLSAGALAYVAARGRLIGPAGGVAVGIGAVASAVTSLITLGLARGRELAADAGAARLTGDPAALADGLEAIARMTAVQPLPHSTRFVGVSHLMIASPFRVRGSHLWASHPDTALRVARLRAQRSRPI